MIKVNYRFELLYNTQSKQNCDAHISHLLVNESKYKKN